MLAWRAGARAAPLIGCVAIAGGHVAHGGRLARHAHPGDPRHDRDAVRRATAPADALAGGPRLASRATPATLHALVTRAPLAGPRRLAKAGSREHAPAKRSDCERVDAFLDFGQGKPARALHLARARARDGGQALDAATRRAISERPPAPIPSPPAASRAGREAAGVGRGEEDGRDEDRRGRLDRRADVRRPRREARLPAGHGRARRHEEGVDALRVPADGRAVRVQAQAPGRDDVRERSLDADSCQVFQNYLQQLGWRQARVGVLYGTFEDDNTVRVECIREPPQNCTSHRFELLEDAYEETVEQLVAMLRLRKVGWIVAHPPREDGFFFSAQEVVHAAYGQLEAGDGPNATPFVTVRVTVNAEDGTSAFDAYQAGERSLSPRNVPSLSVRRVPGLDAVPRDGRRGRARGGRRLARLVQGAPDLHRDRRGQGRDARRQQLLPVQRARQDAQLGRALVPLPQGEPRRAAADARRAARAPRVRGPPHRLRRRARRLRAAALPARAPRDLRPAHAHAGDPRPAASRPAAGGRARRAGADARAPCRRSTGLRAQLQSFAGLGSTIRHAGCDTRAAAAREPRAAGSPAPRQDGGKDPYGDRAVACRAVPRRVANGSRGPAACLATRPTTHGRAHEATVRAETGWAASAPRSDSDASAGAASAAGGSGSSCRPSARRPSAPTCSKLRSARPASRSARAPAPPTRRQRGRSDCAATRGPPGARAPSASSTSPRRRRARSPRRRARRGARAARRPPLADRAERASPSAPCVERARRVRPRRRRSPPPSSSTAPHRSSRSERSGARRRDERGDAARAEAPPARSSCNAPRTNARARLGEIEIGHRRAAELTKSSDTSAAGASAAMSPAGARGSARARAPEARSLGRARRLRPSSSPSPPARASGWPRPPRRAAEPAQRRRGAAQSRPSWGAPTAIDDIAGAERKRTRHRYRPPPRRPRPPPSPAPRSAASRAAARDRRGRRRRRRRRRRDRARRARGRRRAARTPREPTCQQPRSETAVASGAARAPRREVVKRGEPPPRARAVAAAHPPGARRRAAPRAERASARRSPSMTTSRRARRGTAREPPVDARASATRSQARAQRPRLECGDDPSGAPSAERRRAA